VILKLEGATESQPLAASANCLDGDMEYISSYCLIKRSEAGRGKKNKTNNPSANIVLLFLM